MKKIKDELLSSTYMNERTYESMHVDPEFSKWMFDNFDVEDFEELEEIWSVGSKLKELVDPQGLRWSQIAVDETMTCKLEVEMDVAFWASPGWRIICIGDQHGEIGLMRQLLELATGLKTTAPQTKIVYLGDLIDRGPDSLACLDLAISSQTFAGIDAVGNICGNHEELLYTAIFGKTAEIRMVAQKCWEMNGGSAVLQQLGKAKTTEGLKRALGDARLTWLRSMTTWQRSGQFLFVHAGLNPMLGEIQTHQNVGIDLTGSFDESSSTRWIRKPFHQHQPGPSGWYGSFVVHGHDPDDGQMPYAQMQARCRLNLDGGSYRTMRSRMAVIEKNHIRVYSASL